MNMTKKWGRHARRRIVKQVMITKRKEKKKKTGLKRGRKMETYCESGNREHYSSFWTFFTFIFRVRWMWLSANFNMNIALLSEIFYFLFIFVVSRGTKVHRVSRKLEWNEISSFSSDFLYKALCRCKHSASMRCQIWLTFLIFWEKSRQSLKSEVVRNWRRSW